MEDKNEGEEKSGAMASFAGFAFTELLGGNSPTPTGIKNFNGPAERRLQGCILCMTNKSRVFPVSSAEATSGAAPSSRRYVRILQRRRSPPSPRLQGRQGPGRRPRWPASLVGSQRCRPWFPPTRKSLPQGPQARGKLAAPSALFHQRRIRHGAHPYFQFLAVWPFSSARGRSGDPHISEWRGHKMQPNREFQGHLWLFFCYFFCNFSNNKRCVMKH